MNREKQIEEMAKISCNTNNSEIKWECAECPFNTVCDIQISCEALYNAGYRKQSENTIELPCKVGDIVYAPFDYWSKNEIVPYQITNLTIAQNKKLEWTKKYRAMVMRNGKTIDRQLNFAFDELGKTIFLTREEAETALMKMKGGAE